MLRNHKRGCISAARLADKALQKSPRIQHFNNYLPRAGCPNKMACENKQIDWGIAVPLILFCFCSALFSICCDQLAARFSKKIRQAQSKEELHGGCQGFSIKKKSTETAAVEVVDSDDGGKKKTN
jgi:hypothetical protein